MSMLVKCPKCANRIELSDGVKSFGCDNCGEKLFLLDDKVITKGQAQAMLNTLIAKRNAKKDAEAAMGLSATASTVATPAPVVKPVAPAPVTIPVTPAPVTRPVAPAPVTRPVTPAPVTRPVAPASSAPAPFVPTVVDMSAFEDEPKKTAPVLIELEEVDEEYAATYNVLLGEHIEGNPYIKSGAAGGIVIYIISMVTMLLWCAIIKNLVLLPLYRWNMLAYYVVYFYGDVLFLLVWICASSSFMSLGVVRKRPINFKVEMIVSACTVVNIPNLPLMAICNANRKKFNKYWAGNRFNFATGYVATIAVLELIVFAWFGFSVAMTVVSYIPAIRSMGIPYIYNLLMNPELYCTLIAIGISLSRLIKLSNRGKEMIAEQKTIIYT